MAEFVWRDEEFAPQIRRAPGMIAYLEGKGTEWVAELNTELHAAQARRKQTVEDGYDFHVTTGGTRARLYIVAETARAQAHEAANSSILKLMRTTGFDVNTSRGRRFVNPNPRSGDAKKAVKNARARERRAEKKARRDAFLAHVSAFT
jgi:hypothetical protein